MPLLPASRPSPSTPAPHLRSTNATTFEHPPPTSTPHPLPALPPLPSLPPHYQQQPSSVEASRETSVDADAEGEEEAANASAGGSTRGGRGRGKATGGGGGGTRGKGNASAVPASAATPAGTGETGAGEQAEVDWSRTRKDNHVRPACRALALSHARSLTPSARPRVHAQQKEVERRRRETINEGISSLALLLPSPSTNKGSILKQAVSYIAELKQGEQRQIEKWALEKLLHEQAMAKVVEEREGWKIYAEGLERERERWRAGAGVEGQEGEQEGESKVGTNGKRVAVDEVANSNGAAVVDGLGEGPAPKKARVEEGAS